MKIEFGYAKQKLALEIPDAALIKTLTPNKVETDLTGEAEVRRALNAPIGSKKLRELVVPKTKVVIVTSDITRPMPSYKALPAVIEELNLGGVPDSDITVVFALGSHRGHTEEEMRHLAGDAIFERVSCVDSDPNDCVHLGVTKAGTPVDITRAVAEADFRILMGNIEYHYFAGYSGGMKAIMPGVSTRAAIQSNHSRMVMPGSYAGRLEGNPVREDIEEVASYLSGDFILNVVLNEKKEIIRAVAGDAVKAHRAGCAFLDTLYKIDIPDRADLVIVSPGGAPKDMNMYQAQKALDNAKHAVKQGGAILWLAECKEGLGEKTFEQWMTSPETPDEMVRHIRREFKLGGHKAAAIALVQQNAEVMLYSCLDPQFVSSMHITPVSDPQQAIDALMAAKPNATVIAMPYGGSTLPNSEKSK